MVQLASLWLPILVSAAAVFFASSLVWMALPIHRNDYKKLGEKEDSITAAIRSWGLSPGLHRFPSCDPESIKGDPQAQERMKTGPWGVITIMSSAPNMGKLLGLWMVNLVILTTLIAYVASRGLPAGTDYLRVFQVVGVTALLAHAGNALTDCIWRGRPWSHLPGAVIDGVIYAGITAGMFGWLWPKA